MFLPPDNAEGGRVMRFYALATDYDGTLASDGVAADSAIEALRKLRASGRRSILVTGRILSDLRAVFPHIDLFDAVVAENGAVLFVPSTQQAEAIASAPPAAFVEALRAKNVSPLDVGEVIVSTWHPHEDVVLQTIRELGLDLTVIFNKGAVMVLPSNVNKATGLAAQIARMGLSRHNIAAIGDAENDLPFLTMCEASAATANALKSVQDACDYVTSASHGDGVDEFIQQIITDELNAVPGIRERHAISLGTSNNGDDATVSTACKGILLAGTSGGGKTSLVTGFLERLNEQDYQVCVLDPEGDYAGLAGVIPLGDAERTPNMQQLDEIVRSGKSVVISLLAVPQPDRPAFAHRLIARVNEVHASVGRPHWLIVDEAHHALPSQSEILASVDPQPSTLLITTRPELIAPRALAAIEIVIAVGDEPGATIASACSILGLPPPSEPVVLDHAHTGTAVLWRRSIPERETIITTIPARGEHRRHLRKYAQGELAPEKSFYFTGPEQKQRLRAQNLMTFAQLADGVDDDTWEYHRGLNHYSTWIETAIGDHDLSDLVRQSESNRSLSPRSARDNVIAAIRERYTLPA
jgi:hydroxymethylpyrimidine pyrophosphatase-like HAD family hydrolase